MAKSQKEIQQSYSKRTNYAAQKKYDAEKVKHYHLKLNMLLDSDIIDALESESNKNGFIKECIRNYIKK